MSFEKRFDHRWMNVIFPALSGIRINEQQTLVPRRLDDRTISDSILTGILSSIGNSRLIFADISSLGMLDGYVVRNCNAIYELGIAHAIRLPEELLVFRSDNEHLLFDIANVRVNLYNPDERPEDAIKLVQSAALEALREVDLKRHLAVQSAVQSLDGHAIGSLLVASQADGARLGPTSTMGQALGNAAHNSSIPRLLALGAIATRYPKLAPDFRTDSSTTLNESSFSYHITPFGYAMLNFIMQSMGGRVGTP